LRCLNKGTLNILGCSFKWSLGCPPPPLLFVFSLEQEVAGELSSAFTGCSGLGNILKSLEGRSEEPPTIKPMAIKRRRLQPKAKVVAKAAPKVVPKPAAKVVPKPAAAAVPKPAAEAVPVAKAVDVAAVPVAKAVDVAAAPVAKAALSDTRKCVHSRAYKSAARVARIAGKTPSEISAAACKAGKEANEEWDREHLQ